MKKLVDVRALVVAVVLAVAHAPVSQATEYLFDFDAFYRPSRMTQQSPMPPAPYQWRGVGLVATITQVADPTASGYWHAPGAGVYDLAFGSSASISGPEQLPLSTDPVYGPKGGSSGSRDPLVLAAGGPYGGLVATGKFGAAVTLPGGTIFVDQGQFSFGPDGNSFTVDVQNGPGWGESSVSHPTPAGAAFQFHGFGTRLGEATGVVSASEPVGLFGLFAIGILHLVRRRA